MSERIYHVISNTHWDREWRFPFQRNRQMLVEMLDEVLHILETEPEYRAYHLDSQSVMVTDYLEARPHKKELLTRMVQEKRLFIGPWYTLPDEFMTGGETLIRNLLRGQEVCQRHGGVSRIGYSPFSWGQISQLPQIYREFGINLIMFYRGINTLESPGAEFIWEGADGTRALSSRFSTWPRYNFYFYIYRPVIHGEQPEDIEYKWSSGGAPFHFADPQQGDEDYFMTRSKKGYTPDNIRSSVERIIHDQANDFTTRHVIWMEGHDSSGPHPGTVQLLKDIRKEFPTLDIRHSTLEDYADALAAEADTDKLPVVTGERRSSQFDHRSANLYGYTLSARMYLKQAHFHAERWLQYHAEPLNCLMGLAGLDIRDRFPEMAWDLLIQNSAHDSIGGCSLDPVHNDMMHRYRHCEEITTGLYDRAARHLASVTDLKESGQNDIHLIIVNTTPWKRSEINKVIVDIPREFDRGHVVFHTTDGSELPFQLVSRNPVQPILEQPVNRPMYFDMIRYTGYLKSPETPPMGFEAIRVIPASRPSAIMPDKDESDIATSRSGSWQLDNGRIRVIVNPDDGTLDIMDHNRGRTFAGQAWIYDEGEAGHAWVHESIGPFVDSRKSSFRLSDPVVTLIENGPLSATVAVDHRLSVAADLAARKTGDGRTSEIPVRMLVTVRKDTPWPELTFEVDNRAESHRLRVMFPLGLDADFSRGEGQFDLPARPTRRPDTANWVEQPMYDYPMHHFVDVSNDTEGVALLADGLKEYEVLDDPDQTLAITLLRTFEYRIPVASNVDYSHMKGSQCPGQHRFRMAFYPHPMPARNKNGEGSETSWNESDLFEQAFRFNYLLRYFQTGRCEGTIPPGTSFLKIEPQQLIFSALKKARDSFVDEEGKLGHRRRFVLRIFNPTDHSVTGTVTSWFPVRKATQVTLEEKPVGSMVVQNIPDGEGTSIAVTAQPKQILSILLEF